MEETTVEKTSLWREGMSAAWRFLKAEWQWVVVLAGLVAIKSIIPILNYDSQGLVDQLKQTENAPTKMVDTIQSIGPNIFYSSLADLVLVMMATYAFAVLFLRYEGGEGAPSFSFGGFFSWLGAMLRKYALLAAPSVALTVLWLGVSFLTVPVSLQEPLSILFVALSLCCMLYFYVGLYSLYCVTPMAVLHEKSVIRNCFSLIKGNLIRVWFGAMMVWGLLYVVLLPILIAEYEILKAIGTTVSSKSLLAILTSSVWQAVSIMFIVVYACVVYRVLSKERREAGLTA
ncbi:MAG: hypothetical protein PHS57_03570 [Alphaproteobacteria bacterium]|nr:hypothetical protein [Alphaproteobacteria bacterium]